MKTEAIIISEIHQRITPIFLSILVKHTASASDIRTDIINRYIQSEICHKSISELEVILQQDPAEIMNQIKIFITQAIQNDHIIEAQQHAIQRFFAHKPTIIHAININPIPEINRYKSIIVDGIGERPASIFALMINGIAIEQIANKINLEESGVITIIQDIIQFLRIHV